MLGSLTRRQALMASAAATTQLGTAAPARSVQVYRDPAAPVEVRVSDLLARMTLEEKAAQMQCMWERKIEFLDDRNQFSAEKAARVLQNGIGHISRPTDIRGRPEWETTPFRSFEDGVKLVNDL